MEQKNIPDCPFNMKNDIVCAEFIPHKSFLEYADTTDQDDRPGDFVIIGVGPGLPDKDGNRVAPDVNLGEVLVFQSQNAYLFKRADLPNRKFAMIKAGQILAGVNEEMTTKTDAILFAQ
jgi:co-chaperonin GroES (HSP10)